jgi:hypothetical protein
MVGIRNMAWKVVIGTGLQNRQDVPETSNSLTGGHLDSMPLRGPDSPHKMVVAKRQGTSTPNIYRSLVHSQSVCDPVRKNGVLWTARRSHRIPSDDGKKTGKSRRLVGENLGWAVAARHLHQ